jgi:translocation and assembly module TamA
MHFVSMTRTAALWLTLCVAVPVQAAIDVEVEGLSGELLDNVELRLAIAQADSRKDLDQSMVAALHQQAPDEIRTALQPFGYYRPEIDARLEGEAPNWRARYQVQPGPRTHIRVVDFHIDGAGHDDFERERRRISRRLLSGIPLLHSDYENFKSLLATAAYSRGYLDARYTRSELRIFPEDNAADVHLTYDTGPQYFFGPVTVDQGGAEQPLEPEFVARYVSSIRQGEVFEPSVLLDAQFALSDLEYFDSVEMVPDREHTGEDRQVPIIVKTTPRAPRRYEVGVGYGTDTGARIGAGAEFRRLTDSGHKLRLESRLSEVKNTARGEYRIPLGIRPGEQVALAGELTQERFEDGESRKYGIDLSLSRTPGEWQRRLYLTFTHEQSQLGFTEQQANLLMPGISFNRSELDDPIYTRRGWSLFADLHGGYRGVISDVSFVQFRTVLRGAYPVTRRTRLLGRYEFGASAVEDFGELPASQRYFAGGDQSVRGYKYQSLGPQDSNGNVIGGRFLTVGSLELETRVWDNWGAALFYDIGGAGDNPGPKLYQGVGVGLRYRAPVGSIQLDVAHPLDDPETAVRLHIGIRVGL